MKYEITRSYTRKVNLGNYETADHYSCWKAFTKGDETKEELDNISEDLALKCEDEVESKINPTKTVNRRVSMAALRSKLAVQQKELEELRAIITKIAPFN